MKSIASKNNRRDDREKGKMKKTSSSPSTPSSPSIIGGGRTNLSEKSINQIVDLISWCNLASSPSTPDLAEAFFSAESQHKCESRRRKIIRSLSSSSSSSSQSSPSPQSPSPSSLTPVRITSTSTSPSPGTNPKVRITLMQNGTSKKATVVLLRSTPLPSLLKSFQTKLKLKTLPTSLFVIRRKEHFFIGEGDLQFVCDDETVFGSYDSVLSSTPPVASLDSNESEKSANKDMDKVDAVELCKLAYAARRQHYDNDNKKDEEFPLLTPPKPPIQTPRTPLNHARSSIPAANYKTAILDALLTKNVIIIGGETGCGKSTQIPQFLLDIPSSNIIVTQPRKVAAISLAERVADELGCPNPGKNGGLVGFNVRLSKRTSKSTRITYVTTGILLRMLISQTNSSKNTGIHKITHVVIDEVHERDLTNDFLLALLKQLLKEKECTIKVVIMSATADPKLFQDYYSSDSSDRELTEIIRIPGRTFPVNLNWISDCEKLVGSKISDTFANVEDLENASLPLPPDESQSQSSSFKLSPRARDRIDLDFICGLAAKLVERKDGAILIFLPGSNEIESLLQKMKLSPHFPRSTVLLLPLYSSLPQSQQRAVFKIPPTNVTKIIVSTNAAETSITIEDVVHVIDSGRVKESRYNSLTQLKELCTVWSSQASLTQRSGRAGRVKNGFCWRLYPKDYFDNCFTTHTLPEIFRTPLEELILNVALLEEERINTDSTVDILNWLNCLIEPPRRNAVVNACGALVELSALVPHGQGKFRLSTLGYHLSRIPMDPSISKMLITGCCLGCLQPALIVAAVLSCTKSVFTGYIKGEKGNAKAREIYDKLIDEGFGGVKSSRHVKCDLVAAVAVYSSWLEVNVKEGDWKVKRAWAANHALDNNALLEVQGLITRFKDLMIDAGFCDGSNANSCNENAEYPNLLSCCIVSGLYPNIAILQRPKSAGDKSGGKLVTTKLEVCRPHFKSFQCKRIKEAASSGKSKFVMYHSKERSVGVGDHVGDTYLHQVSFVSPWALLLFGGDLTVDDSVIKVGRYLKMKIGSGGSGESTSKLVNEVRSLCDELLRERICSGGGGGGISRKYTKIIGVIKLLLAEEC